MVDPVRLARLLQRLGDDQVVARLDDLDDLQAFIDQVSHWARNA